MWRMASRAAHFVWRTSVVQADVRTILGQLQEEVKDGKFKHSGEAPGAFEVGAAAGVHIIGLLSIVTTKSARRSPFSR